LPTQIHTLSPTRRSSDLDGAQPVKRGSASEIRAGVGTMHLLAASGGRQGAGHILPAKWAARNEPSLLRRSNSEPRGARSPQKRRDRKSTRLNSSHVEISY